MIQINTISCDVKTVQLFVDIGIQALSIQPESVWIRNSESELQAYTNQILKPDMISCAADEKNQISALSISNQTELNNLTETAKKDILDTTQNQINYLNNLSDRHIKEMQNIADTASTWAIGTIEEEPNGSSKYWAETAQEVVNSINAASESVAGFIQLSTADQAQSGTDNTTAMTPQKVKNNFVDLHTAQTINGVKTFTGDIKRTINIDISTVPDSNTYIVPFTVNNGDESLKAYQQIAYFTNGTLQNTIGLRRNINGTNIFNTINLDIDSAGNKTVHVTTPESTSNGQNIATTAWVNTFCKTTNKIVTEWSGNNANSWYRKWSNGFIEQGGIITGTISGNNYTVSKTFYKPFTSIPCLTVNFLSTQGNGYNSMRSLSATAFSFATLSAGNNYQANSNGVAWYACGF